MDSETPVPRVTVSEDKLYRALAEQELRLLKGFEERMSLVLEPLDKRIFALEIDRAGRAAIQEKSDKHREIRSLTKPSLIATFVSACGVMLGHFWH